MDYRGLFGMQIITHAYDMRWNFVVLTTHLDIIHALLLAERGSAINLMSKGVLCLPIQSRKKGAYDPQPGCHLAFCWDEKKGSLQPAVWHQKCGPFC